MCRPDVRDPHVNLPYTLTEPGKLRVTLHVSIKAKNIFFKLKLKDGI